MSELSTLARPYAEAVFRLAQSDGDLAGWSSRLNTLATIVSDAQVARLIGDPAVSADRVADLVVEVAGISASAAPISSRCWPTTIAYCCCPRSTRSSRR